MVALGVSIGACTYVLLPKQEFVFTLNGIRLYETLYAYRDDEGELHRRLAYWLEGYWRDNQAKVDELAPVVLCCGAGPRPPTCVLDVGPGRYHLDVMRNANPEPPPAPPAPPPDLGHPETKGGLGPLTR